MNNLLPGVVARHFCLLCLLSTPAAANGQIQRQPDAKTSQTQHTPQSQEPAEKPCSEGGDAGDCDGDDAARGMLPRSEFRLSKGGLTLSGGYSTYDGPNTKVSIVRSHLADRKRELSASLSYSRLQTSYDVTYTDAEFLKGKAVLTTSVFANRRRSSGFANRLQDSPFEEKADGGVVSLRVAVSKELSVSASYRLSRDTFRLSNGTSTCDAANQGNLVCNEIGARTTSAITIATTLDRRDNPLRPTRGFRLRATETLAGLGGSTRYFRTQIGADAHARLGERRIFSISAEVGTILPIGGRSAPLFDRFYLGGKSLRGFDLRGVGPRVLPAALSDTSPEAGTAIGARHFYQGTAELTVPLGEALGSDNFSYHVFAELGSSFGVNRAKLGPDEKLFGNSARPRIAAGVGVGWKTPIGVVRADLAFPVSSQPGDRIRKFSISIGTRI